MSQHNENTTITITISGSISASKIKQIKQILDTKETKKSSHDDLPRGTPTKFGTVLALKEVITKDNNKIKDGIPLTSLAWALYKENNNDLKKAINDYIRNKVGFAKKYEEKVANRVKK
jgi:hypothetical protein